MKKTRFIAMLLVLSFCLAVTACNSSSTESTTAAGAETEKQTDKQTEEETEKETTDAETAAEGQEDEGRGGDPIAFSYLRPVWSNPTYEKGNEYEQMFSKIANVEISANIIPVADFNSKVIVMIAGGTDIDVIWNMGPGNPSIYDIIDQGAFLPLNDLLEKYPSTKDAIYDATWDRLVSPDGNYYFFPNPLNVFVPFPIYYRTDIIEELGLEIPTTIDEFTDFLRDIHEAKPEMVTFTTSELFSEWYFQNIYNAFGYNHGWMEDPDNPGTIIPSNITKYNKDALEWINLLRREGLIDPDYMIAAGKRGSDTFKAGNAAVIAINWDSYQDLMIELRKNVPEAGIGLITSLEGPGGISGADSLTGYDRGFSLNISAADKADDIFRFLDWVYTDGYIINRYGFEGKTYNVDDKGNIIVIPSDERDPAFNNSNVDPFKFPIRSEDTSPNWLNYYNDFMKNGLSVEDLEVMRFAYEDAVANYVPNLDKQTYSPTQAQIGTQLNEEYLRPAFEKLMIDPDADISIFDEAVEAWLANGGQAIIDEINAAQADKSAPVYNYENTGPDYR